MKFYALAAATVCLAGAQTLGINHYGFGPGTPAMLGQLSPATVPVRMTFYWHNIATAPDYYDAQVGAATQAGVPLLGILGYSARDESSMPAVFDFTEISPFNISWHTARGPLAWGTSNAQGTVKYVWHTPLEDGRVYPRAIAVKPTAVGSFVHGDIDFQVPKGHSVVLWAKVGFTRGPNSHVQANFSITYLKGGKFRSLTQVEKERDGSLATLTADISSLVGTTVKLFFNTDLVLGHPAGTAIWQGAGILVDGVPLSMAQAIGKNLQPVINYPPKDPNAYAAYAANLARRYPQIEAWEVWNEPNTAFFWRPAVDVESYVHLLKEVYRALKGANPRAKVLIGGLSPGDDNPDSVSAPDFLSLIYRYGGREFFDAVAYHAYGEGAIEDWLPAALAKIRNVMATSGDGAMPLWITEIGCYTEGPGAIDEEGQAKYLLQARAALEKAGSVERAYWYTLRDADKSNDPEKNYGLFRADGTPKPAVKAFDAPLDH